MNEIPNNDQLLPLDEANDTPQPTRVDYTEENIRHLDDMEHIRVRSGMYIGRLGDGSHAEDGIYVLLKETIDNSIDEFKMNAGKVLFTIAHNSTEVRFQRHNFSLIILCSPFTQLMGNGTEYFIGRKVRKRRHITGIPSLLHLSKVGLCHFQELLHVKIGRQFHFLS